MMQNQQIASVLQGLRGAQPAIVLLYLALRSALSLAEIEVYTGLSNDSVSSAVRGLVGKGWLVEQTGQHGKKYYLPISETFDRAFLGESLFLPGQNPVFPDSGTVVDDVAIVVPNHPLLQLYNNNKHSGQNPVFPDSGTEKPGRVLWSITTHKSEDEIEACKVALAEAGIYGRKAEQCALYDWTTPDYIRAIVAAVMGQGDEFKNPLGMAIYRIENNLPVQPVRENGHLQVCACAACRVEDKKQMWHEHIQEQLSGGWKSSHFDLSGEGGEG
jgi:hypothetical protein